MNTFTYSAIFLVFLLAVSHADETTTIDPPVVAHNDFYAETRDCIPGKGFIDKCNRCHCNSEGIASGCTLMFCNMPEKPHIDGYKDGMKCIAGKTFYNKCNECICDESGKSAKCTPKDC